MAEQQRKQGQKLVREWAQGIGSDAGGAIWRTNELFINTAIRLSHPTSMKKKYCGPPPPANLMEGGNEQGVGKRTGANKAIKKRLQKMRFTQGGVR